MEVLKKEELYNYLKETPQEITRLFETQMVDIALSPIYDTYEPWIIQWSNQSKTDDPVQEKVYFSAFCVRVNRARRMHDRTREFVLLNDYYTRFGQHPFYTHMRLLSMIDNIDQQDPEGILQLAYINCQNMPNNAGAHHALADTVAKLFEAAEITPERRPDEEWLKKGEEAVHKALALDPNYAKFYCTKARILSLQGNYNEALQNINIAIDRENSSRSDYALRIGKYQMYEQIIRGQKQTRAIEANMQQRMANELNKQMDLYLNEVRRKQAELEQQANQSMSKNMEFLGLFAGSVSFTIGGISIASTVAQQSLLAAAGLLIVLMGSLLGVFAGFGIILHGYKGEKSRRNLLVFSLGILVIIGGIVLCLL